MARILILIITSLVVWSTLVVSANDCRVRDKYSPELWNGDPLKILAFTSDQDGFTCMLNFQRLDNYLFYDQIVLSKNGNKVIRTDHGNIEYLDIHSSLNDTGWNEFIFSIDDNSTFMATVRDDLVLNYTVKYPVKTITTYGSNISLCSSPSWAVGENEAIVIPLYPRPHGNEGAKVLNPNNSSIYFTLSSTASFNPAIKVDGIKRYLTMKNGEMLLSQDLFQPLRLKKYHLEVHTQKQTVDINCKLDNVTKKLMEFQVATVLLDIEISSQGMSFIVELDLSSILFTTTTSITTTTTPTTVSTMISSALAVATNDGNSAGLVVGIIITILLLLTLVMIIIFYMRRRISSMITLKLGFHEETQQEDRSHRNGNSEIGIFIDDKNSLSSHDQKPHYDGNYKSSIPEKVSLMGSKEETRLQEENHSDDGNCSRSTNDLETLSKNVEGARHQEENHSDYGNSSKRANYQETLSENGERARSMVVSQTIAKNDKINTNDAETAFVRTEDNRDDMDELEITLKRQSELKDTDTCGDLLENKEQESGALPPNELQSTMGSSSSHGTPRSHVPPIEQKPSTPRADILQGHLPHGANPPHVASPLVNPILSPPHSTPQPAAIHPHTYKSSGSGEHRIDAHPELSQAEIDKNIYHIKSVYSSAISQSNTFINSGEYTNAREALVNAITLINQSKVANDSRGTTRIKTLKDKHDEIKSKIDDISNPNRTQPPHLTTSKEEILDQLSLYEAPSAGYQFQVPQDNSSGNQILLPTQDSQSAGVLTQFHQNDYQQKELVSTGKRASNRRSNKQHQYVTTPMSFKDERDQTQVKPDENVEHLKQFDADKKEQEKTLLSAPGNFPTTIQPSNDMSHLLPNEHKPLEKLHSCEGET